MGREDFPAAHSMDTEWFAVDEHGRVGRFDSGEDGAVPIDAAVDLDFDALGAARLANVLASGADPVAGWDPPPKREAGRVVVAIDPGESYRGADAELALLGEGFVRVGQRLPIVLLAKQELPLERVEALAAQPGVRWVLSVRDLYEALQDANGADGLYTFHHDHGADPGLYERVAKPEQPLALEDLPEGDRAAITALRLAVDFAEDDVHLADLIDPKRAHTWGDTPLRITDEWPAAQEAEERARLERKKERWQWVSQWGLLVFLTIVIVIFIIRMTVRSWPK